MTDSELWSAWRVWMVLATLIIVVAAVLLIMIWRTARAIHTEALRALQAAEKIRDNTNPIWALETTNDVAGDMLATVQHIGQIGGTLAAALESHAGAR